MSAPVVAPQVGMHRSDETGWWMIDSIDYDTAEMGHKVIDLMAALKASLAGCDVIAEAVTPSPTILGYHLIGKNGVESYLSADRIGTGWVADAREGA